MKQKEPRGLPPCSLSAQCLRLLDELDSFVSLDDIQDERMLEQLREHIPTCPTCTAILAQARHIRAQQRTALRDLLADSELKVPSTTSQILAAIHSEERLSHQASADLGGFALEETEITSQPEQLNGWHSPSALLSFMHRPRMILRNVLILAAVVTLILASVALFGHQVLIHSHPSGATTPVAPTKIVQQSTGEPSQTTPSPATSPSQASSSPVIGKSSTPAPASSGWNSVIIASTNANGSMVTNYNYQNGDGVQLNTQQLPANTQFDGVSPDGTNLLYQFTRSDQTMYFTLPQSSNADFFYEVNEDDAGNAIWLDHSNVLIETADSGVVEVNTQTGQQQAFLPNLKNASLKFVRNGFLYFVSGEDHDIGALYRIDIASGEVQPLTVRSLGGSFWLSPDGSTIYFKTSSPGGQSGIYAVNSNGTNSHRVLLQNGVPIGYAADNSLMIIQEENGKFEVVKVSSTSTQVQIVSSDVAHGAIAICNQSMPPGIIPICDNAVALAPNGHALVVQAYYPDGSHQVLSVDLTTGKHVPLQVPTNSTSVQLIGWDQLSVG